MPALNMHVVWAINGKRNIPAEIHVAGKIGRHFCPIIKILVTNLTNNNLQKDFRRLIILAHHFSKYHFPDNQNFGIPFTIVLEKLRLLTSSRIRSTSLELF